MSLNTSPSLTVVSQCVQATVVISACHPNLGPVYWCFVDGSDHNAADCYTLTTNLENALTLRKGWREGIMAWSHRDHMSKLMLDSEQFQQEHDIDETRACTWSTSTTLGGVLKSLQARSGQDVDAFTAWLTSAAWLDVEAPGAVLDFPQSFVSPQLHGFPVWQRLQA
ncbi:hypothetical protein QO021_28385 (plasmid) [Pseudomonas amygdali pv. lachrymans]|uniref:hypothetical protein n=1 Tax=Pseudomonas amygdali TaxID=47877 RepID=UPI0006B98878|nr:hypothetical protein [Pseudomonas amygdali]KPC02319.1 Uncharacterized protein AC501_3605 [Pseudomonas amygdali pv. lachrymans]RMM39333.1 hypothetical protein ALQ79_200617 [Pseudomonas amygdali pv. lachrymans]WIO61477.1 hypothetical protein QO021_28385 [Pseudomonas amygdali pv. lachrymans]